MNLKLVMSILVPLHYFSESMHEDVARIIQFSFSITKSIVK